MRLEKKIIATLLAAILIAIVGVMPALADNPVEVSMTVNVMELQVVSINVSPDSISFPNVTQGGATEALEAVVITNDGNVYVNITASVIGTDTDATIFYESYLYTSPDLISREWTLITGWNPLDHILCIQCEDVVRLQIDMGGVIPVWGQYSATLVFWAEAMPEMG